MEKEKKIKQEVEGLLSKLGVDAEVEISTEEAAYKIQINTQEDAPYLIGRHGDMLQSIQRILEAVFYKMFGEPTKLVVNVNDYREHQKERLIGITENVVERFKQDKRDQTLRQFSPYERKVVHEYIAAEHPSLSSHSEGEGRDRVLIITAKDKKEETSK